MIAIIDYDAGNTQSVINALKRLDVPFSLTDDGVKIRGASHVILPGVGHAGASWERLKAKRLIEVILSLSQPFLGICVGMQLMYGHCAEGAIDTLGIFSGSVEKFDKSNDLKIPHIGWNDNHLFAAGKEGLLEGIKNTEMYFVHSFRADIGKDTAHFCNYQSEFTSYAYRDNYHGVQFHPEKSGGAGAQIIKNFLAL